MYFHGLLNDKNLSTKRFESIEESSKQNQTKMITLFGNQVYSANDQSFRSGNDEVTRNCLNPLIKDTESRGFCGIDLNQTPVNEPVTNKHQCLIQDLNFPYTEEAEMSCEKSGFGGFIPSSLDNVHEKDNVASQISCCTAENDSRREEIQMAAECLVHISAVWLNQSEYFTFKHGSRNRSSQGQELIIEKPSSSCDSFELHTLGIKETILEDICCVSSKAIDEKEFGFKLRRGRRMKSFQKEILPGLLSLSRHEILEDLNILDAVLRSREYKKIHGSSKDDKCRPNSRKNKDLIQRNVGRRRKRTE